MSPLDTRFGGQRKGIARPTPISKAPEATFSFRTLSGLERSCRARSRNSARPRFPAIGISAENGDDRGDVDRVQRVQVRRNPAARPCRTGSPSGCRSPRPRRPRSQPRGRAGQAAVGVQGAGGLADQQDAHDQEDRRRDPAEKRQEVAVELLSIQERPRSRPVARSDHRGLRPRPGARPQRIRPTGRAPVRATQTGPGTAQSPAMPSA